MSYRLRAEDIQREQYRRDKKKVKCYKKVFGIGINSGHFIPEENPKETIKQLKKFFLKHV